MTCLEKYLQDHPDVPLERILNAYCPHVSGKMYGMPVPDYCPSENGTPVCEQCWNREVPGTEPEPTPPVIKDSGERRQFYDADGNPMAVRDIQEGKGRCDLMPLDIIGEIMGDPVIIRIADFVVTGDSGYLRMALDVFAGSNYPDMLLEVAKHFEEGAKKYGENNWQKGIPVRCYIDSAVRHYLKFQRGDKDEPHNRAFCWNIITACWTCKHKPELNDYAPKRNENTCVCCGATIPEGLQYCDTCRENVNGG